MYPLWVFSLDMIDHATRRKEMSTYMLQRRYLAALSRRTLLLPHTFFLPSSATYLPSLLIHVHDLGICKPVHGISFSSRQCRGSIRTHSLCLHRDLGGTCRVLSSSCLSINAHYQAYTWDWLVSVAQEFEMVKKDGFTVTIAVYFASR
jgi:hypothetical protein